MPTGLKVPVGVNKSGGAAIESDEAEHTKKLLFLAFSEGEDDNPFQLLGIEGDLIFSVRNPSFRGRALRSIERVLAKFSDRISLVSDRPITFNMDVDNEVEVSFEYVDLLTGKVEEFRNKFSK